jgi:hypothetical protein
MSLWLSEFIKVFYWHNFLWFFSNWILCSKHNWNWIFVPVWLLKEIYQTLLSEYLFFLIVNTTAFEPKTAGNNNESSVMLWEYRYSMLYNDPLNSSISERNRFWIVYRLEEAEAFRLNKYLGELKKIFKNK